MVVVGRGYGAGYWSPATATIDWCERNYEVADYTFFFSAEKQRGKCNYVEMSVSPPLFFPGDSICCRVLEHDFQRHPVLGGTLRPLPGQEAQVGDKV